MSCWVESDKSHSANILKNKKHRVSTPRKTNIDTCKINYFLSKLWPISSHYLSHMYSSEKFRWCQLDSNQWPLRCPCNRLPTELLNHTVIFEVRVIDERLQCPVKNEDHFHLLSLTIGLLNGHKHRLWHTKSGSCTVRRKSPMHPRNWLSMGWGWKKRTLDNATYLQYVILLFNCISYDTENPRNEHKYSAILYS